jgi:hypothetical protein
MRPERRARRSEDTLEALGLQLEAVARRARLDGLLLVEEQGLEVASAGAVVGLEEIAAVAPKLAPGAGFWRGELWGEVPVTVVPVSTDFGALFLCAAGGAEAELDGELLRGGCGVCRILA